jgi:hypothetical protein
MNIKFQYKIAFVVALAGLQPVLAQKKDENLGTEVINVVKPYTPTISDAFKVKETPVIEDAEDAPKEEIKYNIFSFPVASTFAPAKGKAASVDKEAREKLFNNYATLGIGNYGTVNAELFITENLDDTQYVGATIRNLSSLGGIDDVKLDDNYRTTGIDLTYGNRQKTYNWSADAGFQNQVYNWYGLPLESITFDNETIQGIDEKQTYNTLYAGAKVAVGESFFHDAAIEYRRFWDASGSAENRFFIKPSFDIDISETKVKFDLVGDYVGGSFDRNYEDTGDITYSNFNLGIQPSIQYQKDDLAVQIGAGVFYSMGKQNSDTDNKFYIYPQIKASYKLVGDLMVAYAGAEGSLKQNSYADFVGINPFVSPTLNVRPTSQQYDLYVGLKGKLANTVSYNIRGSYMNEDDKAFFLSNNPLALDAAANLEGYSYGNSFGVVYDHLKTISFFGELKADFSKNVSFGVNGSFNTYTTDQQEAWNLPTIKVGANLEVAITEKWSAGTNVFFVGERKDRQYMGNFAAGNPLGYDVNTVTLDSFFDINAHLGYKYNERLSGFLRLNNIANQDYQKWVNYQVQGFQFLIGASYKFNF